MIMRNKRVIINERFFKYLEEVRVNCENIRLIVVKDEVEERLALMEGEIISVIRIILSKRNNWIGNNEFDQ
jgi:hypothetical protein